MRLGRDPNSEASILRPEPVEHDVEILSGGGVISVEIETAPHLDTGLMIHGEAVCVRADALPG